MSHRQTSKALKFGYDNLKVTQGVVNGGKRAATVFLILNDVKRGGEFIFPRVKSFTQQSSQFTRGECAQQRYSNMTVKASQGSAILMWNLNLNGTYNMRSEYGICPPDDLDEEWVAVKWYEHFQFLCYIFQHTILEFGKFAQCVIIYFGVASYTIRAQTY